MVAKLGKSTAQRSQKLKGEICCAMLYHQHQIPLKHSLQVAQVNKCFGPGEIWKYFLFRRVSGCQPLCKKRNN